VQEKERILNLAAVKQGRNKIGQDSMKRECKKKRRGKENEKHC